MTGSLTAADRIELWELCARYSWSIDARDRDHFASLFTEDGAFCDPRGEHRVAELPARIIEWMEQTEPAGELQHWAANAVLLGE